MSSRALRQPVAGAVSEGLKRAIVAHYERALERFGPTARGMDWKDEQSQRLRFELLCDVCDLNGKSLLEVGAGAGHLVDLLRERSLDVDYSGIDLSAAMVEAARRRHPEVLFQQRDLLEGTSGVSDVVLCSGLFHVKLDHPEREWRDFVHATLRRMYDTCRVAIAFNAMSDAVDFRNEDLYYANPGKMLDFCRGQLSRHVALRHDYPLHEYTVYVYREPRAG